MTVSDNADAGGSSASGLMRARPARWRASLRRSAPQTMPTPRTRSVSGSNAAMKRLRVTAGYRGQAGRSAIYAGSHKRNRNRNLEALPTVSHLSPRRYDLFEQLRELSALFQRLMQERAAVFQQALPFFLSQP